jgi:signal transduction histidine kinase
MNSLRSRLLLGSSLIAVVPLTAAILLLSQRMGATVRTQAAARLEGTLAGLRAQLADDAAVTAERVRIQARDPQLRRLFLVRPAGGVQLAEFLAERRFLLGLDLVRIVDANGVELVDGMTVGEGEPVRLRSAGGAGDGLAMMPVAGDTAIALVARAPILYAGGTVGVLEGAVLLGGGRLARLKATSGVELVLGDGDGRPLVATRDGLVKALARPGPGAPGAATERLSVDGESYLARTLPLSIGPPPHARISGFVSTAASDATVATLQWTAAALGMLGLALAIALALVWSSQVSRPVEVLAAFSDRMARGEWDQPLALDSVRELEALVASLERMRGDLHRQRERLATSERQAAWGQMARKVAHEVRNPLTPIAVSIADLKRSHDLGRPDFPQIFDQAVRTIGEEVETLKRMLQEFADFGRMPPPTLAPCRVSDVLAGLETLYSGEIGAGRLAVVPPAGEIVLSADAGQLRQALVNLIKNGLEAVPDGGRVTVAAGAANGTVEIAVSDNGPGLSDEQKVGLFVPGFTTKSKGSGLGLTIVERIVNDHRGTIAVESGPGRGTTVRLRLPIEAAGLPAASAAPAET